MVQETSWLNQIRTVDHLSDDVWMRVFGFLGQDEHRSVRAVCRRFRTVESALRERGSMPFPPSLLFFLFLPLSFFAALCQSRVNAILNDEQMLNAMLKERGLMVVAIGASGRAGGVAGAGVPQVVVAEGKMSVKDGFEAKKSPRKDAEPSSKWKFTLRKGKK